MNINIITFQRTYNCGAALQAYALSRYLEEHGHNVSIVDYRPKWVEQYKVSIKRLFSAFSVKDLLLYPYHLLIDYKFSSFVKKYCKMTPIVKSVEDIVRLEKCDIYVTGSDQVWNSEITKGIDRGYLLDFKTDAKRISYAASCGWDLEEDIDDIVKVVRNYDGISVREHSLEKALKSKGVENVIAVWDPVFLLDADCYYKMLTKAKYKNYVLLYLKHESEELRAFAAKIAQEKNLQVVDMSKIIKQWPADRTSPVFGPLEFLGLIESAEYVVTNSFHGTAFSIIFRKNFYSFGAGSRTTRLSSLLEDVRLNNRMLTRCEDVTAIEEIDYSKYEDIINEHVNNSREFLLKNCKG